MRGFLSDADLDRLGEEFPELSSYCPTCHDQGRVVWRGVEQPCCCDEQKQLHLQYLNAGVGILYQRLTWEDLEIPEHAGGSLIADYVGNARAYIDRGVGLFLTGGAGTGKTAAANLVLKDLIRQGVDCYATTFSATVEAFTAGWSDVSDKHYFARRFMRSQVLLLDDLGKEFRRSNRLHQTTFDHILRTRVQNARPTLITTNMSARELQEGYGAAILSLLVEQSIEVQLSGKDFRPRAHERTLAEINAGESRPIT